MTALRVLILWAVCAFGAAAFTFYPHRSFVGLLALYAVATVLAFLWLLTVGNQ